MGSFDDQVVTLNLALVGVLERLFEEVNIWLLQRALSRIASAISRHDDGTSHGLFLTRSVDELLWGYEDPVLSTVSRFTDVSSRFSLMQNSTGSDETPPAASMVDSGLMDIDRTGEVP